MWHERPCKRSLNMPINICRRGILAIWKEFEPAFYEQIVTHAQNFVNTRIGMIHQKFPLGGASGDLVSKVVYEAEQLKKAVNQIKFKL